MSSLSRTARAVAVVIVAATGIVCAGAPGGPRWFPLQTGNDWEYTRVGPGEAVTWRVTSIEADGQGEERHFMLDGYFGGAREVEYMASEGDVCDVDPGGGPEGLWYRFAAKPGDTWVLRFAADSPPCLDGTRAEMASATETVTVPAGTFHDVVRVDYAPPCVDAGLIAEWFAPGVGLVRRIEDSFAGPVVSELVQAKVGLLLLPALPRVTALAIDGPTYGDPRPGFRRAAPPTLKLAFEVQNAGTEPVRYAFAGCQSATIRVIDEQGWIVLETRTDDGGCCSCKSILQVVLEEDMLALRAELLLAGKDGRALPDGRYAVVVTLDTLEAAAMRPMATEQFELHTPR